MKSWHDVLAEVEKFQDRCRADGSAAVFRGERDASWVLKSSLHRHIERLLRGAKVPWEEEDVVKLLRLEYSTLYNRFRRDAWPLLDERERTTWGPVFAMQHFGLPTRLLDFTNSFACALFFAQWQRQPTDGASVWALDPEALNRLTLGRDGLLAMEEGDPHVSPLAWHPASPSPDPLPAAAMHPVYSNARMVAQQSAFLMMGDSFLPLDSQYPSLVKEGHLARIVLPVDLFDDAEGYLDVAGVTPYSYYPDLQGVAYKHEAYAQKIVRDAKRFYPDFFR